MAVKYKDADGNTRYRKNNSEAGSLGDPDTFENKTYSIDGGHVTLGAKTDAAAYDTDASISGHLRGIAKIQNERHPASLGQKAMTASFPVVLASDQSALGLAAGSNTVGAVKIEGFNPTLTQGRVNIADGTVLTDLTGLPTSGQRTFLKAMTISVDTTCEISIKEQTSGNVKWAGFLLANTTLALSDAWEAVCCDTADRKLQIVTSVATKLRAYASYYSKT